MNAQALKTERKKRGWTQAEAAERLGVSQAYVALLEEGRRSFGPKLVERAVKTLKASAAFLPLADKVQTGDPEKLPQQLSALGYPGFAYLRPARMRNPGELLVKALAQDDLDPRVTEALPWLLLHYEDLDVDWLLQQARVRNLSNRLGFVVGLAKAALNAAGKTAKGNELLDLLEAQLKESRLAREDTLCQSSLSERERDWLRQTRPPEAEYWNLLTDWRPEHLQYAAS